jgi:hypothetical protein
MTGPARLSSLRIQGDFALEPIMPSNDEAEAMDAPNPGLVAVTVDLASGRIVRVEGVDAAGERHELTDAERAGLADAAAKASVRRLVERAFEAGIDCALGEDGDADEGEESAEDAELSSVLLRSLIDDSGAGRLMEPDALRAAIVGTLIEQAVAPKGASTH